MGFLNKLWDETLAGPVPETGLGKLRKYDSFSGIRLSPAPVVDSNNNKVNITRTITIRKSDSDFGNLSVESGSPSWSSTPRTTLSQGRFARRKPSAEALESSEPRSPTVYDWIVISALDR